MGAPVPISVKAVEGVTDVLAGHPGDVPAPSGGWGHREHYGYGPDSRDPDNDDFEEDER